MNDYVEMTGNELQQNISVKLTDNFFGHIFNRSL